MANTIAAVILTKNEEKHIARCINSLLGICEEIIVVDCYSTDDTVNVAESLGARVYKHKWLNYATQFNWGVHNCQIAADWIWRIDADEFLSDGLGKAVKKAIASCPENVNGIYVRKRIDFMGHPLLHGGWYPTYHLKVFRCGHGDCENRWMDEHIRIFDGITITIRTGNQVDANLNDLTWWTNKHNGYASREMIDMIMMEYEIDDKSEEVHPKLFGTEEQRKRWLKIRYIKLPLFLRPFLNFILRYIFRGGFLDGKEGFIWHILQGFWYRMLVDAKIFELKKRFNWDKEKIKQYIEEHYILPTK
jgi:glycosyltransferase involved in cell wall biosynthesis